MSIGRLLSLTLLGVTLILVTAYSWLMEANIVSGVLLSSEFRLNRAADAWIESKADLSTLASDAPAEKPAEVHSDYAEITLPPIDGTPILHAHRETLPLAIKEILPGTLKDGQFTKVDIDGPGLVYNGYMLHLFRTLPNGQGLHVVQRLKLADSEQHRVQQFDDMADKRLGAGIWFIGGVVVIMLLIGHRLAKGTKELLRWSESLSIDSIPDHPPALPFVENRRIAASVLDTVRREADAIAHQHRFLRFASHELRTPLAIASANTELLARHGVGADGQSAFDRLEESIKKMNSLTDTLLWLGRGENQLQEPETVDLLDLVNNIVEANDALASGNNVVVEVVWASKPQTVQPRVLLEILCSNLIGNAIRHTRNGRVEIRLTGELIEIENRGDQLGEEVADDSGYGLGLELVAWVVERANWQWEEEGDVMFRRHRVRLART